MTRSGLSGFQFVMSYRIVSKIEKAGAISKENAVTAEEAGLDSQEQAWLPYFAGVFLGRIKKTEDKRYYI
ncbi:MAG: hypothetical protein NWE78_06935 [Candidatus Bathyarchaeota archaeon]|nr:hypothetical protein [Candidatus Bathyarchaeota archaeon]